MRQIRHHPIGDQVGEINAVLRGHYAYYGVAGNLRWLSRCIGPWSVTGTGCCAAAAGPDERLTWDAFNQIKERTPLLRPKLRLPYRELQALAVL